MRLIAFAIACLTLSAQPSDRQTSAMAALLAERIGRSFTRIDNAAAQGYIAAFGARLGYTQIPLTLMDGYVAPPLEPIMLPDRCVVPSSLVLAAHDESELAAMLAQALARGF